MSELKKCIPTKMAAFRAAVSVIPVVGGALDHLLFDKADEIRISNIEKSINNISERIKSISEENLSKEWFGSAEALGMFRLLVEKIQFEGDDLKIKSISDIYTISGTKKFAEDPNKLAVLRTVAELTTVQKELLLITSKVEKTTKTFDSGTISVTATAIWFDDIMIAANTFLKTNSKMLLREGVKHVNLNVELGFIESLNLIYEVRGGGITKIGYNLTALGLLLKNYLEYDGSQTI